MTQSQFSSAFDSFECRSYCSLNFSFSYWCYILQNVHHDSNLIKALPAHGYGSAATS